MGSEMCIRDRYYEDELARALAEDGSASSTYITPKAYYPGA